MTSSGASRRGRRPYAWSTTPATRPRSDRMKELCDAHGIALIEDVAHAPSATLRGTQTRHVGALGSVQLLLQQGPLGRRGRPAVHGQRRGRRARALAALALDDERHLGAAHRAHRHLRRNRARLQLPPRRAARRAAALAAEAPGERKSRAGASSPFATASCSRRSTASSFRSRTPTCRAPPAT